MGRNEEKLPKVKDPEPKIAVQETETKGQKSEVKDQDTNGQMPKAKVQETGIRVLEPEGKNQEVNGQELKEKIQEPKVRQKVSRVKDYEDEIEEEEPIVKTKGKKRLKASDAKSGKRSSREEAPVSDTETQYSSIFYWHSFLLYCGRILHSVLDVYNQLFDLGQKDKAKLYSNISKHYINKGLYDKALTYLKEWSKAEPTNTEPFYQLGIALYASGNRKSALGVFSKVLTLDPEHMGALHRRSSIFLKIKDFKGAAGELEKAIKLDGENPRFFYLYAIAQEGLGETDKAIEALEKAIDLDPDEIKYHQHLGFLNVSKDDHKTAAKSFTKVMELEREMDEEDDEESY
ncbi:MAG: tetratricopeptide repeat protein [Desulfamplus sp.]|nr:tetratricopeptide repeat protein [Desulfamplus sp.]